MHIQLFSSKKLENYDTVFQSFHQRWLKKKNRHIEG